MAMKIGILYFMVYLKLMEFPWNLNWCDPWKIWNSTRALLKGHGISMKSGVIKYMTHEMYFHGNRKYSKQITKWNFIGHTISMKYKATFNKKLKHHISVHEICTLTGLSNFQSVWKIKIFWNLKTCFLEISHIRVSLGKLWAIGQIVDQRFSIPTVVSRSLNPFLNEPFM